MAEKLLIIGAGLSGLYLASLLEEKYEVTLVEARDRLGGRVFSIDGHDMGPSWIWSHHKNMLHLVSELKLELFSQYNSGYALYDTKEKLELFNPPPQTPSARVNGTLSLVIDKLQQNLKKTTIILNEKVISIKDLGSTLEVQSDKTMYEVNKVIVTLPPRLCTKLNFIPTLSEAASKKLMQTQTWMGNSAKCVVEFKTAFWREQGLSGFVFSNQGPLGEIHDASTQDKAALFGFVSASADMKSFNESVRAQFRHLFKITDDDIVNIHLVDWRDEVFSSAEEDSKSLATHPEYGIDLSHHNNKVLFSATEFSHKEGGYLEGALIRAQEIVNTLVISS